jgi:hypothetical protein
MKERSVNQAAAPAKAFFAGTAIEFRKQPVVGTVRSAMRSDWPKISPATSEGE